MAKDKKTTISSILMADGTTDFAAVYFELGGIPLKANNQPCVVFPPVSSIIFCRHAYGQGAAVDQACYAVSFEDSPQKVIIPANRLAQITVVTSEADETKIPPMPTI